MTKGECAIVMAYTGIAMLTGDDIDIFYRYIDSLFGRPVYTHELIGLEREIKARSKEDFLKLCKYASDASVFGTVRCKDCKWSDEYYHCDRVAWWNTADDFCSRGERRDG